jgi:hypothetical protein
MRALRVAAKSSRLCRFRSFATGSSQQQFRLPILLAQLGQIDLFIHDSLHSERNVRFEVDRAWAVLRPGGAIVVDDIDVNRGFHSFTQSLPAIVRWSAKPNPCESGGGIFFV